MQCLDSVSSNTKVQLNISSSKISAAHQAVQTRPLLTSDLPVHITRLSATGKRFSLIKMLLKSSKQMMSISREREPSISRSTWIFSEEAEKAVIPLTDAAGVKKKPH